LTGFFLRFANEPWQIICIISADIWLKLCVIRYNTSSSAVLNLTQKISVRKHIAVLAFPKLVLEDYKNRTP